MSTNDVIKDLTTCCWSDPDTFTKQYKNKWNILLEQMFSVVQYRKTLQKSEFIKNFTRNFNIFTECDDFPKRFMVYVFKQLCKNCNLITLKFKIKNLFILYENYQIKQTSLKSCVQNKSTCLLTRYPFLRVFVDFEKNVSILENNESIINKLVNIYHDCFQYNTLNLPTNKDATNFLDCLICTSSSKESTVFNFMCKSIKTDSKFFQKIFFNLIKSLNQNQQQKSKASQFTDMLEMNDVLLLFFENKDICPKLSNSDLQYLESILENKILSTDSILLPNLIIKRIQYMFKSISRFSKQNEIVNLRLLLKCFTVYLSTTKNDIFVIDFLKEFLKVYDHKKLYEHNLSSAVYVVNLFY